jgi:hypothetical protein
MFVIDEPKVRRILRARRIREQTLGSDLFADPAWDLLLEAFAADLGQRRISVADLCCASPVPSTTALRWIQKLEQDDWLCRAEFADGAEDIELTAQGAVKLRRCFEAIGACVFLI